MNAPGEQTRRFIDPLQQLLSPSVIDSRAWYNNVHKCFSGEKVYKVEILPNRYGLKIGLERSEIVRFKRFE